MNSLMVRMMTLTAGAALAVPLALMQPAGAATAPDLACGNTQPGPCTETAHFSDINDTGTPLPPGAGCPASLVTDYVTIVGTGNGIEHITVNKAQDGWFTSTFTGTATITLYPPSSVTVDNDGNVTIVGPPDANETPYTGKITQWFGGSFNKQNAVDHSTFHFDGTNETGQSFRVQDVSHEAWTPGTDPNGPPNKTFDKFRCS